MLLLGAVLPTHLHSQATYNVAPSIKPAGIRTGARPVPSIPQSENNTKVTGKFGFLTGKCGSRLSEPSGHVADREVRLNSVGAV